MPTILNAAQHGRTLTGTNPGLANYTIIVVLNTKESLTQYVLRPTVKKWQAKFVCR